jgi:hypothetical protein
VGVRIVIGALALVILATIGGCGNGSSPTRGAQPVANGGFVNGILDQVPHYPSSEPLGGTSETAGTVARTYKVTGATPRDVLQWYRDHLAGWSTVTPPEAEPGGATAVRGIWRKADTTLTISADNAPTLKSGEATGQNVVQYSLSLTGGS